MGGSKNMNESKYVELKILNPYFGTFSIAKVLKETEKAMLLCGLHGRINEKYEMTEKKDGKLLFYNAHWVPKRFIKIVRELKHCYLHDRLYSDICFDCLHFVESIKNEVK